MATTFANSPYGNPGASVPGGNPSVVPPPTSQLAVLFIVFVLFGLVMGGLFIAYVLPEACKREAEKHIITAPTAPQISVPAPVATTTIPIAAPVRTVSASPYSTLAV